MTENNSTPIRIPLNKGFFTVIDSTDQDIVIKSLQVTVSSASTKDYATINLKTPNGIRPIRLHRLIMERMLGRALERHELVDHIDGDGLNNQRANLRLCTKATNAINSKRRSDNQSGFKGVCFHPYSGLWRAYIRANNKQQSLGYYKTPEEAHEAYKKAAAEIYGEFARFG